MKNLIFKIKSVFITNKYTFENEEIVMNIDDFFSQKKCEWIIGANLEPEIPLEKFYLVLKKIESNIKTENIFVRICDIEDKCKFSDAVYILGNWNMQDLRKQTESLFPTEIYEGFLYDKPKEIFIKNSDHKIFTLWWD